MNKKASSIFYGLMIMTVLFVLGMALAPALKDVTQEARDDSSLNCSTTTDDQTKAVCTSIDLQQLYIGIIFGIAGLVVWRAAG